MKKIGVIGALNQEIEILKESMEIIKVEKKAKIEFITCVFNEKTIMLAKSGVGKVNAAICAQIIIDSFKPDYMINIGVAGAIHDALNIGDIVISKDLIMHDFNASPIIPDYKIPEKYTQADGFLIKIANEAAETLGLSGNKTHTGRIASGDCFINESDVKNKLWADFEAVCVEMEGAAIAQACWMNNVPFVVVRAVSDKADEEAELSFDKFVNEASMNSGKMILEMIKRL